jgi:hypothetical protein
VAAEFGEGTVEIEVVTLKDPAGAARYRDLRREAGEHLPVPCVLVEGRLVAPGIPEQDELRDVFRATLGTAG